MTDQNKPPENPYEGHWEPYVEYSRTLRAWLISYGIGAPVLFITQESLAKNILESGNAKCIIILFVFGVFFQVLIAFINKCINWIIYAQKNTSPENRCVKLADKASNWFWLDIMFDVLTVIVFVLGTYLAVDAVI